LRLALPPLSASRKQSRTRIALARSLPTKAGAKRSLRPRRLSGGMGNTGAPTGAGHLSYFIRDQLYPGIINKNQRGGT